MHAQRLNIIAKELGARRYLEVGVCEGSTFINVDIEYKVAVDPNFLFDFNNKANDITRFLPVTSDEFFQESKEAPFDLIFLDGLHTFEQTLRDFLSSQRFSHKKTVWVLDDTVPNDCFSALPNQDLCYQLRQRALAGSDWSWMGDVFKVVFFLGTALRMYDYRTFEGHGQTVVWQSDRFIQRASVPLEEIGGLGYEGFVTHMDKMQFASDDRIFSAIGR